MQKPFLSRLHSRLLRWLVPIWRLPMQKSSFLCLMTGAAGVGLCAALGAALGAAPNAADAATTRSTDQPDYARLFPHVFARQGPPRRQVSLTFDDGPDSHYTLQILDVLKREGVHATFFVLGEHVRRYPDVARRIVREGHALGNHSFDHRNLRTMGAQALNWEVTATDRELLRATGQRTRYFRAPYGSVDSQIITQLGRMGYTVVNWSVDSRDWRSIPSSQVIANVLAEVRPGAIILQHCAGNEREILTGTVAALPVIIHRMRAQGYEFVTVPTLLGSDSRAVHAKPAIKHASPPVHPLPRP